MAKINFEIIDDWNYLLEIIEKKTKQNPLFFKVLDSGSSDYLIAYSTEKFHKSTALSIWRKLEDNY